MERTTRLEDYLERYARLDARRAAAASAIVAIAEAGRSIAALVAAGSLGGSLAAVRSDKTPGDAQTELDVIANDFVLEALSRVSVAAIGSEEMPEPLVKDDSASIAIAVDPLDGSSNIDTNAPVGTIFSILPAHRGNGAVASFLQSGTSQIAAGYLIYGPQTALVVTFGDGTQVFTLDRERDLFLLTAAAVAIAPKASEFAINGSNYRHWDEAIRHYVNDCLKGTEGPRGRDFNTRWIASLVAEAYRIMVRGGIYLYPADARRGYGDGRLRLVYEANPIAWLIEQAGGAATEGRHRILDLVPMSLHQKVPLVFGSREEVERVAHYIAEPLSLGERSPLFGQRGLFRA